MEAIYLKIRSDEIDRECNQKYEIDGPCERSWADTAIFASLTLSKLFYQRAVFDIYGAANCQANYYENLNL